MKIVQFTLIVFLFPVLLSAQSGQPFCIWEDPNTNQYNFCRHNASTGVLNVIAPIAGCDAFVAGSKSALNPDAGQYHFVGLSNGLGRLYTIDIATGNVINNVQFLDNVVGIEYNGSDSTLYGLREAANNYDLVSVDPATGAVTSIGIVPNMTGYVGETFVLDPFRNLYAFVALDGGNLRFRKYRLSDATLILESLFNDPLTELEFNCQDSMIYALWENAGQYLLERLGTFGGHSTVANISTASPGFVAESSSMHKTGLYTYRGFNLNNDFAMISIDPASGNIVNNTITSDNAKGFEEDNACGAMATDIQPTGMNSGISVFPNPVSDQIRVFSDRMILNGELLSLDGRLIRNMNSDELRNGIDVSEVNPGSYVLQLTMDDSMTKTMQIVINR